MLTYKIVTDSSSDLLTLPSVPFAVAPLKIITSEKEYTDNEWLDVAGMVNDMSVYKGRSSTSCPNAEDWLNAFGDADRVMCVTITGTLSGCYNAACIAKQMYEEMHPDRRVFVLNSLTTGPEMKLIIEKIEERLAAGDDFETVCDTVTRYTERTGLMFMLESMKNLANNGRVSPFIAKAAGLLGIRVVGKASAKGDLQPLDKCRGQERSLQAIVKRIKEHTDNVGKVRIAHCVNEDAAQQLKTLLLAAFERADIEIYPCGGLCSFYAEKGGLLVGYEAL